MKYAFIAAHTGQFAVQRMCQVLRVGRSGYYAWAKRPPSSRAQANQALLERIRDVYQHSRQSYGSPRLHLALRAQGIACGRHRVARLMRASGLCARPKRRFRPTTTQRADYVVPAPNRLNQDFSATAPNQKWASDFTYIETGEGWLYLAVVIDLFSD
jgi:transposase InsO family protein